MIALLLPTESPHCPDFLLLILAFFLPLQWINLHECSDLSRSVDYSLLSLLWSTTALKTTIQQRPRSNYMKGLNCSATLLCSSGKWMVANHHRTRCLHTRRIIECNALFFEKVITLRFNSELVLQVCAAGHWVSQGGSVREVHSVLVLLWW